MNPLFLFIKKQARKYRQVRALLTYLVLVISNLLTISCREASQQETTRQKQTNQEKVNKEEVIQKITSQEATNQNEKNLIQPFIFFKYFDNAPFFKVLPDNKNVKIEVPLVYFSYKKLKRSHILVIKGCEFEQVANQPSKISKIFRGGPIYLHIKLKDRFNLASYDLEESTIRVMQTRLRDGFLDLIIGGPSIEVIIPNKKKGDQKSSYVSLLDLLQSTQEDITSMQEAGEKVDNILDMKEKKYSDSKKRFPSLTIDYIGFLNDSLREEKGFVPLKNILLSVSLVGGISYILYELATSSKETKKEA